LKAKNSLVPAPAVRKQVTGTLTSANEVEVVIHFEGGELTIPYTNIEKANVVFEVSSPGKPHTVKKKK
jgi:ribosome maturation factor RimP